MTKEEKISEIKNLVNEYNEKHVLTYGNEDNAGKVDYYEFNSSDILEQMNADSNEPVTLEELGLEPDTYYYELELFKFRKLNEEERNAVKESNPENADNMPEGDWFVLEADKQYLTKDFNYFYKQAKNVLTK